MERQGGFRSGHSTVASAASFVSEIMKGHNRKKRQRQFVYVDFRKAFDVIAHDILLQKLLYYGANQNSMSWFASYLTGRSQPILVNESTSSYCSLSHGVPQGSCLGPLFFLVYINDLVSVINPRSLQLYADDTVIYHCAEDVEGLETGLQSKTKALEDWCLLNRLTISFSKKEQSKLQILQNKCIRAILNLPKRTNVDSHHVKLRLLHVENRRNFNLMKYCYRLLFYMNAIERSQRDCQLGSLTRHLWRLSVRSMTNSRTP